MSNTRDDYPLNNGHPQQPDSADSGQGQQQLPPAPPPKTPKPLDLAALRKNRAKREETFQFTLYATTDDDGNPFVVEARLPSIFDADGLADLPSYLRRSIIEIIESVERLEKEGQSFDDADTKTVVENFGSVGHIADAYVINGFVKPRVYATAEEADEKGGAWVRDISSSDRIAFFHYCTEREGGVAADVKPFPGQPVPDVGDRPAGTPVSGTGQS